jgi:threonine aldolase
MRQSGYLAAAGIYALDHHMDDLAVDNRRASALGDMLNELPFVKTVHPVDTNIVILELEPAVMPQEFLDKLAAEGIRALSFGGQLIRLVTHREITDDMLDQFYQVVKSMDL